MPIGDDGDTFSLDPVTAKELHDTLDNMDSEPVYSHEEVWKEIHEREAELNTLLALDKTSR